MTKSARNARFLLLPLLVACGGTPGEASPTPAGRNVEGTVYTLVTVNGGPLPALLPTIKGCALTGQAGTLTFRSGGRFGVWYRYLSTCRGLPATIERQISGRYSANGAALVLAPDSGFSKFAVVPPITGTIDGAAITIVGSPRSGITVTLVVRRQ